MALRVCMQSHTHREYRTWTAWLEKQWNIPSRSDNYLMQIAAEIKRTRVRATAVIIDHFKLLFTHGPKKKATVLDQKAEAERVTQQARAGWAARGLTKVKKTARKE